MKRAYIVSTYVHSLLIFLSRQSMLYHSSSDSHYLHQGSLVMVKTSATHGCGYQMFNKRAAIPAHQLNHQHCHGNCRVSHNVMHAEISQNHCFTTSGCCLNFSDRNRVIVSPKNTHWAFQWVGWKLENYTIRAWAVQVPGSREYLLVMHPVLDDGESNLIIVLFSH